MDDATPGDVHEEERLPSSVDVVVVGGGITGCAAAYFLAGAGAQVAVLERFDLNTEASGRNAGSLHGQIQHQPFVERGEAWARRFLPALEFLVDSVALWRDLGAELGTDLEVTTNGGLLVAETPEQMRDIERKVRIERAAGFTSEVIGRSDLRRLAPYVSDAMVGAELAPSEGVANPLLAAPALALAARARGASIHTNVDVLGIEREQLGVRLSTARGTVRCRQLVVAAGSGLVSLAAMLDTPLPIDQVAVQLSATEPLERFVEHLVYFAGDALTFKQAKAGTLLIGGGWPADRDLETGAVRVSLDSLRGNLRVAQKVVPAIGRAQLVRSWAGVVTRDSRSHADHRDDRRSVRHDRRTVPPYGPHRRAAPRQDLGRSHPRSRTGS